jgi:hypothetical protein
VARQTIRDFFINVVTRAPTSEDSFNWIQKDMRELRRETTATQGTLKKAHDELKAYQDASKKGIKVKFDTTELERARKELDEYIERLDKEMQRRFRLPLPPEVRETALKQQGELQGAREGLDELRDYRELQAERQRLAMQADAAIEAHAKARDENDLSRKLKFAHVAANAREALKAADVDLERQRSVNLNLISKAMKTIGSAGKDLDRAAQSAKGFGDHIDGMTQRLKAVFPILRGVGVLLVVALLPALIQVAAGIVNVIGAVVGLAAAFGAALGPVLAVVVALFQRLGAVMEAFGAHESALDAKRKKALSTSRDQAATEERIRNARNTLRDATQAVTTAEREYGQAAHEASVAARKAYEEIEDAAEEARQAVLDLAEAQLDLRDAQLGVEEAKLALQEFKKEIGATTPELDKLFRKVVESGADPAALAKLTQGLRASGGITPDQALEAKKLTLDLEQAKQKEKQATFDVAKAEDERGEALARSNFLQRVGIKGTETYRAAQNRLASASEGLRDAHESVEEAQRDLKAAYKGTNDAMANALGVMDTYRTKRGKLTEAEKAFLDAIIAVRKGFRGLITAGTDPIFRAFTTAIKNMGRFGGLVKAAFKVIGEEMAGAITKILAEITSPRWAVFWLTAVQGARDLIGVLGDKVFINFLRVIRNLAIAFMPHLIEQLKAFANWLGKIGKSSDGLLSTDKRVKTIMGSFSAFTALLGSVIGMLVAFGVAVGPAFEDLTKWITKGVEEFRRWLESDEGQKRITKFFKDVDPFVKALVKSIIKFGKAFMVTLSVLAPFLAIFFEGFNTILDIFIEMGEFLDSLMPSWLKGLLVSAGAVFLGFAKGFGNLLFGFGKVKIALKVLIPAILAIGAVGKPVWEALKKVFDRIWGAIKWAWEKFKWLLGKLRDFVQSWASIVAKVYGPVFRVYQKIGKFLGDIGESMFNAGKAVAEKIYDGFMALIDLIGGAVDPVKDAFQTLREGIVGVFKGIGGVIKGIFRGVMNTLLGVINLGIKGINAIIDAINAIPDIDTPFGTVGIPDIDDIPEIKKLGSGGLTRGATFAEIGEAGREAVLPLTKRVFRQLGEAVAAAMPRTPALATPQIAGEGGSTQHFHIYSPPGTVPDGEHAAAQLAQGLKRRGKG